MDRRSIGLAAWLAARAATKGAVPAWELAACLAAWRRVVALERSRVAHQAVFVVVARWRARAVRSGAAAVARVGFSNWC